MSQGTGVKSFCTSLICAAFFISGLSQTTGRQVLRFVFYNTENFFDTHDDSLKQDNEFLPHGLMKWNAERYKDKVNAVYKVLIAAGEWDTPAIAGFCEIEKKSVLYDLLNTTYLGKNRYGIIHEESEDLRGIDVCLIYRKDLLKLIEYRFIKPNDIGQREYRTRRVLYSKLSVDYDTIHLFLNHWPSRRGGVLSEESLRKSIAEMIRSMVDSLLLASSGTAKIIIAGDFNCSPDDPEISILAVDRNKNHKNEVSNLVNLSTESSGIGEGTYKFQGRWELLDQVIVSQNLINCEKGLFTTRTSFNIFNTDFLLEKDPIYPGKMPFSTYRGYRYHGGFSDHLPVILDIYKH
jgi:hypothetical protein